MQRGHGYCADQAVEAQVLVVTERRSRTGLRSRFAIGHARRQVLHWSVTEFPSASWVVQQLREAFSFDVAPKRLMYLIFDRDSVFSAEVIRAVASMALRPKRISYRSPWQNGVAERLVASVRRELLDHVIVLHEQHLRRLLSEYWAYYHKDRTHLGVDKDAPVNRRVEQRPAGASVVFARRRVADCTTATVGG